VKHFPQRSHERLSINVPLEYEGFERFYPDRTLNVSAGGVFIMTPRPIPRGQRVCFGFELPDLRARIRTCGSVVWTPGPKLKGSGARHPMGMAVQFDKSDVKTVELIKQYVTVESALRSLDTRIGKELPIHLRLQLPVPEGEPEEVTFSDIAPTFEV
jgi:uncharacterized protein (TIGR02266 family)